MDGRSTHLQSLAPTRLEYVRFKCGHSHMFYNRCEVIRFKKGTAVRVSLRACLVPFALACKSALRVATAFAMEFHPALEAVGSMHWRPAASIAARTHPPHFVL